MIAERGARPETPYGVRNESAAQTADWQASRAEPILLGRQAAGIQGVFMRIVVIPALVAAALFVAACGSNGSSSTPTAPSSSSPGTGTPTIVINRQNGSLSFSPNPAAFGGQMVVFRNADSVIHRVQLNDMSVDTGDITPGATSRAVQMPAGGTNYHCALHPDMVGAINASGGAPPPPCEGVYCDTAR
jgi:plastocyanin